VVGGGFGVDGHSLVSNLSDISVVVVGGVLDVLGAAVGKSDRVRSGNDSGGIGSLSGVEGGLGVVVGDGVFVNVWCGFFLVGYGVGGGVVWCGGRGVVRSRGGDGGVVRGGGVVDGMVHGGVDKVGGVDSMDTVGVDTVVDGVGGVVDGVSEVGGVDGVGDDGAVAVLDGGVAAHVRNGGGRGQGEEGDASKSLEWKFRS